MEDSQIVDLFFRREESAIVRAQEKYSRLCRGVAQHILSDERDAEECVSDAYLRAWNAIPPERPRSLKAYLARITRNLALDRFSYNSAAQRSTALTEAFEELEGCLSEPRSDEGDAEKNQDFRDFLNRFLRSQSRDARTFFIRRYWYGESIGEIASACGVGEEKVKSSLFRTRNRLQEALHREEAAR